MRRTLLGAAALVFVGFFAARAIADPPPPDPERRTPTVIAVEKAAPAVVNISTTKLQQLPDDPFFRAFFRGHRMQRKVSSVGSGVIVHPDGYVITNRHVVRRATEIVVSLGDSEEVSYPAVVLAESPRNDLALLKIEGERPFPSVTMGRSDDLMIGEPAIAVGNPFAVGKSVTTGVISAVDRTLHLENGVTFEDFIQTDAAINPGNSGGPLLNIHGEMIGVNTAIRSGSEGIGFAIPVDRVKEILERLIEAAVEQANLGFRPVSGPGGVTVTHVEAESAAGQGGLVAGDVIERVDRRNVETVFDFATPILAKNPGDRLLVTVLRRGERRRVDLVVPEPALPPEIRYIVRRLGVVGRDPTEAETSRRIRGVIVEEILEGGPADRVGMEPGDLVVALGGKVIALTDDLVYWLRQVREGRTLEIEVVRAGRAMTGSVTVR